MPRVTPERSLTNRPERSIRANRFRFVLLSRLSALLFRVRFVFQPLRYTPVFKVERFDVPRGLRKLERIG